MDKFRIMTNGRDQSRTKKRILYVVGVVVVGVLVGTLLFFLIKDRGGKDEDVCADVPDEEKFDCHPDRPVTEKECLLRGCCYKPASDLMVNDSDLIYSSDLGVPSCYYPKNFENYKVKGIEISDDRIQVQLAKGSIPSGFDFDVGYVHLDIDLIDDTLLRIKFSDPVNSRFEPDVPVNFEVKKNRKELYKVEVETNGQLTVSRKTDNTVVFKTQLTRLIFGDQFLQLSSYVSSTNLYGLGEQKAGLRRNFNFTRYTLFNQGDLPVPHRNLYGSHPFYLVIEPSGNANGVFLLNSNAMDYVLQPAPAVTFRTVGGEFDFFVMLGPTPSDVVKQYTKLIGRPFMIPYWSLGFQICKYGYYTLNKTDEILQRNLDAGVPLDVQWHDIDFMDNHLDFTYDNNSFYGLPEWVDELHAKGMHYIAMISPGVSNTEEPGSYPPYDEALQLDLFIKDEEGQKAIESKVWNTNFTVYPDYSNPAFPKYWARQFERYHKELQFDGVWIDMNEPLNFMNGSENGCPFSRFEHPAYLPGRPFPLSTLTICMSYKHNKTIHYNEHNLMAFREASATYGAMKDIRKKRPFIISRATFAGQGVHSGHWSGDIDSTWEDMRYTIPFMLGFNMYGMPMVGSDICGFRMSTTEELCTRWQALGAFYPLSRNHNDVNTVEQDPAAFGNDSSVLKSTKDNLHTRYYMLPYYYTLFYQSHVDGETVVRPLFFEFPKDPNVYDIDEEFLIGPAILIMPALYPGVSQITPYVPKDTWYSFYTGVPIESKGEKIQMQANSTFINIAVRGGYIIPLQIPGNTTTESRKNDFDLIVAFNKENKANGVLYWDDGDSLDTYESGDFNLISFSSSINNFSSTPTTKGYMNVTMNLNEIKVYGVTKPPKAVECKGKKLPFKFTTYLSITATGLSLLEDINMQWE